MPQVRATVTLQLVLLLSALPAQYLISRLNGSTAAQRYHATTRLLRLWREWRTSYLNGTAWMDWTSQQVSRIQSLVGLGQEEQAGHPPLDLEMMMFDNDQGFFGASRTARRPRPPYVFLRVGDVVKQRNGHMVGVVVSWDPEMRAPPAWVNRVYSINSEGIKAENTPHYKVLFSGPGPSSVLVGYIPQTQLERISGMRPDIPTLENYFTDFDGDRFVMMPWLREIFPEDTIEDV